MRTEDLIRTLVADVSASKPELVRRLTLALVAGFAVSAVAFAVQFGPRPDIADAFTTSRFDLKILLALMLAMTSLYAALQLSRPGASVRRSTLALILVPMALAAAVFAEMFALPVTQWASAMKGTNALVCLTVIPLLALPLLIATIVALRSGATTQPRSTGAVAGLLAGGLAGALYAVHCTDDSPLFVAVWYSTAIAIVGAAGAIAGRLWLRW